MTSPGLNSLDIDVKDGTTCSDVVEVCVTTPNDIALCSLPLVESQLGIHEPSKKDKKSLFDFKSKSADRKAFLVTKANLGVPVGYRLVAVEASADTAAVPRHPRLRGGMIVAAIVLFAFGTGPIKGFAVTLTLGIITSMFTAIVGTRAIVNLAFGGRRLESVPV